MTSLEVLGIWIVEEATLLTQLLLPPVGNRGGVGSTMAAVVGATDDSEDGSAKDWY